MMLYLLLAPLRHEFPIFNVLRYPLFRASMAFLVALTICLLLGPAFIRWLKKVKFGQYIRDDGPASHFSKKGTPTMGGLLMLVALTLAILLFGDLSNGYVLATLFITLAFGSVGFLDDWAKLRQRGTKGLSGKLRLAVEFTVSFIVLALLIQFHDYSTTVSIPFIKEARFHLDLGMAYVLFGGLVIVGTANAANLTDGLDGLCIGPVIVSAGTFTLLAYGAGVVVGGFNIAAYLKIPHIPGVVELVVVTAALAGAGVGFLWYNCHPAEFFMGDTGSLALGSALGTLAVLTKNEILSIILHGIFFVEALSVLMQVSYFKYTKARTGEGRRIFLMAPLHHHFERLGWPETKVVVRFWILSVILSVAGLATLKLR